MESKNKDKNTEVQELTKKDFTPEQEVKWCPGCGDYSVLNSLLSILPEIGKKKEDIAVISGIGCSSRFPYYVDTYGFHGIHGRGSAIASGVKLANPNLSVWQITGDGDCMAIGGNHFIHIIRRNIDVNILLLNNKIYGLTKGQYSPTTPHGSITKTSPDGLIERPFRPGLLTIGAVGTFFARLLDTNPKMMKSAFKEASAHKGTSVCEVLQNCVIFNNQVHNIVTAKENKDDHQLHLEHGKPMLFGKDKEKGIILNRETMQLEQVVVGENGYTLDDILVHDAKSEDYTIQLKLIQLHPPEMPLALGVIRSVDAPSYNDLLEEQINKKRSKPRFGSVDELLNSGDVFEI
jgi:2-oxoglutarate ferredoxin oxidoreductase subunit beta